MQTRNPVIVVSMLHELVFRDALRTALSGRDESTLVPLLQFAVKYVAHPRYTPLMWDMCSTLLGMILVDL